MKNIFPRLSNAGWNSVQDKRWLLKNKNLEDAEVPQV